MLVVWCRFLPTSAKPGHAVALFSCLLILNMFRYNHARTGMFWLYIYCCLRRVKFEWHYHSKFAWALYTNAAFLRNLSAENGNWIYWSFRKSITFSPYMNCYVPWPKCGKAFSWRILMENNGLLKGRVHIFSAYVFTYIKIWK